MYIFLTHASLSYFPRPIEKNEKNIALSNSIILNYFRFNLYRWVFSVDTSILIKRVYNKDYFFRKVQIYMTTLDQ